MSHANSLFPIISSAEVTLEANPNDCPPARLRGFKAAGVNRISFGVQSFSDKRLALLGRNHSADEACQAVSVAVDSGISNVSIDLIFGVPQQTVADLEEDLSQAVSLPISHLSTYALTIEPGTPFFQRQERGLLEMPRDSLVAEMLELIPSFLAPHGLLRYEISNYARPGAESVHNSAYWIGDDYLGIGAGAHSYVATRNGDRVELGDRWSTFALPESYMTAAKKGAAISWNERVGLQALQFEFFYVGLRLMRGVSSSDFARRFGVPIDVPYGETIRELVQEGLLVSSDDTLHLTTRGIAIADSVFEQFVR
jgi:oxygen-independent coproporphyrinogen-3 oxidase